jgi:hypothetical protein
VSHNIRLEDGKIVKGYYQTDFQEAFDRYLSKDTLPIRYAATEAANIDEQPLFQPATEPDFSESENADNANKINGCSGVADEKEGNRGKENELADKLLL